MCSSSVVVPSRGKGKTSRERKVVYVSSMCMGGCAYVFRINVYRELRAEVSTATPPLSICIRTFSSLKETSRKWAYIFPSTFSRIKNQY